MKSENNGVIVQVSSNTLKTVKNLSSRHFFTLLHILQTADSILNNGVSIAVGEIIISKFLNVFSNNTPLFI